MMIYVDFGDTAKIKGRLAQLDKETEQALALAFDMQASMSTAYMKQNAPWTDRTGAARNGLHAVPAHRTGRYELLLAHAVSYGIWLEVKYSGRDAIILPSIRVAVRELESRINGMWGRLP